MAHSEFNRLSNTWESELLYFYCKSLNVNKIEKEILHSFVLFLKCNESENEELTEVIFLTRHVPRKL